MVTKAFKHKILLFKKVILLSMVIFQSCSYAEQESDLNREKIDQELGNQLTKEIQEIASLFSLKYDIENQIVKKILLEYIKEYNNHDYQLITKKSFDIEEWRRSYHRDKPDLTDFITELANCTQIQQKIIAGLIIDYKFLDHENRMDLIESELEDLEYEIEEIKNY